MWCDERSRSSKTDKEGNRVIKVGNPKTTSPMDDSSFQVGSPVLRMENLSKHFQLGTIELQVLRGIDLMIRAGEHVAIMGPSGSGKSTLLNIIGCLDRATRGRYVLADQDVSLLSDDKLSLIRGLRIGFVFQSFNLIDQLNVIENIEIPMYYRGYSEHVSARRAHELASLVGLQGRVKHRPAELSGGERQRVAIARALANEPLILLADEPTGNLDSKSGNQILQILLKLHERGKTLIIVTHDESIARHAQSVIHLLDGRIDKVTAN